MQNHDSSWSCSTIDMFLLRSYIINKLFLNHFRYGELFRFDLWFDDQFNSMIRTALKQEKVVVACAAAAAAVASHHQILLKKYTYTQPSKKKSVTLFCCFFCATYIVHTPPFKTRTKNCCITLLLCAARSFFCAIHIHRHPAVIVYGNPQRGVVVSGTRARSHPWHRPSGRAGARAR